MDSEPRRDTRFFGHPPGLGVLAGTELWERFSFYGMQALLMLYMTKQVLLPGHAERVWGLAGYRAGLSTIVGPMSDLAFAAQTYGIYSGLTYATPLAGAWLGDRMLGKTRTVTIGALLMSAGHLAMASERLFLVALVLLISRHGLRHRQHGRAGRPALRARRRTPHARVRALSDRAQHRRAAGAADRRDAG